MRTTSCSLWNFCALTVELEHVSTVNGIVEEVVEQQVACEGFPHVLASQKNTSWVSSQMEFPRYHGTAAQQTMMGAWERRRSVQTSAPQELENYYHQHCWNLLAEYRQRWDPTEPDSAPLHRAHPSSAGPPWDLQPPWNVSVKKKNCALRTHEKKKRVADFVGAVLP